MVALHFTAFLAVRKIPMKERRWLTEADVTAMTSTNGTSKAEGEPVARPDPAAAILKEQVQKIVLRDRDLYEKVRPLTSPTHSLSHARLTLRFLLASPGHNRLRLIRPSLFEARSQLRIPDQGPGSHRSRRRLRAASAAENARAEGRWAREQSEARREVEGCSVRCTSPFHRLQTGGV